MGRTIVLMLGFVTGITAPTAAQAKATVTGRVTILEKDNKPSGDLSDAVVWIETRQAMPRDSNPPSTRDIAINDKVYAPRVVVAPVGSTVRFPNHDPFNHNVFSVSDPNNFDLGLYGRGETKGQTFNRPGLVRVFCNVHPRMVAYVVLVPNRYFAQPGADGSFVIEGVPLGRYRLHAWHERIPNEVAQDVVVGLGTAPVRIALDARKYRFVEHKNKFGKNYPSNAGRERY